MLSASAGERNEAPAGAGGAGRADSPSGRIGVHRQRKGGSPPGAGALNCRFSWGGRGARRQKRSRKWPRRRPGIAGSPTVCARRPRPVLLLRGSGTGCAGCGMSASPSPKPSTRERGAAAVVAPVAEAPVRRACVSGCGGALVGVVCRPGRGRGTAREPEIPLLQEGEKSTVARCSTRQAAC